MKRFLLAATLAICLSQTAFAQEAVVGVDNADALFTSPDPVLNRNKQTTYKIIKELLEANHWERADQYLTERYLQHNPNAASGLKGVVEYFTVVRKQKPTGIPEKMKTKIVSVVAEGDIVTVGYPREMKDPKDPSKTYTTTWFDSWRFVDGKADEHWDPAIKAE
jgi:predicted SnoaL-like aldol condensation-catalyzing enzyme